MYNTVSERLLGQGEPFSVGFATNFLMGCRINGHESTNFLANQLKNLERCSASFTLGKNNMPCSIPSTLLCQRAPLIRLGHSEMLRSNSCLGSSIQRVQPRLVPEFIIIAEL